MIPLARKLLAAYQALDDLDKAAFMARQVDVCGVNVEMIDLFEYVRTYLEQVKQLDSLQRKVKASELLDQVKALLG